MYRDYEREQKTIKDIQNLVKDIEKVQDSVSVYCELMKELFLSSSGKN